MPSKKRLATTLDEKEELSDNLLILEGNLKQTEDELHKFLESEDSPDQSNNNEDELHNLLVAEDSGDQSNNNTDKVLLRFINNDQGEKDKLNNFCGVLVDAFDEKGNQLHAFSRDKHVASMMHSRSNIGKDEAMYDLKKIEHMELSLKIIDDTALNRKIKKDGCELHHLIPRSLGGSDFHVNLVSTFDHTMMHVYLMLIFHKFGLAMVRHCARSNGRHAGNGSKRKAIGTHANIDDFFNICHDYFMSSNGECVPGCQQNHGSSNNYYIWHLDSYVAARGVSNEKATCWVIDTSSSPSASTILQHRHNQ